MIGRKIISILFLSILMFSCFGVQGALEKPTNFTMNSVSYDYENRTVIYYFNSYNSSQQWYLYPERMVNGLYNEFAWADYYNVGDIEHLTGNTGTGISLGNISNVSLRVFGKWQNNEADVILRPYFSGTSFGSDYYCDLNETYRYSNWSHITSDANAPSSWTWSDIQNIECYVISSGSFPGFPSATFLGVSIVEIRVIYTKPLKHNQFNVSWTAGTDADKTIVTFKRNNYPANVDDGYKYFLNKSIINILFDGVFHEGLPYNKNYTCIGSSGQDPFIPVTEDVEDGVNITFMDNATDLASSYFSLDSGSKVNGTYSMKFNNPSISTGSIYGVRHFDNNQSVDSFSLHCRIDTKDNSVSDKSLCIRPYNISGSSNVTYYFDGYSDNNWTSPTYISDGEINTEAYANTDRSATLNSNTCTGAYQGYITKVEIRTRGRNYGFDGYFYVNLTPKFESGVLSGSIYSFLTPDSTDYSEWFDITDDTNAPILWSWTNISNLFMQVNGDQTTSTIGGTCNIVEIRVSYDYETPIPEVVFTDTDYLVSGYNVTINDQGLLDTWIIDRVYNITYNFYIDAVNVTIDDHQGNTGYLNLSNNASTVDGFSVSMNRDVVRNVYLDNWIELNCTTITTDYVSAYNWTYPYKPLSFSEAGEYSTSVNLSWDAASYFYHWDKVHIQRSMTSYPTSPTNGTNVYNGSLLYYEENIDPSTTAYYSAWGYGNESNFYSGDYATARHIASPLRAYFSYHPTTKIKIEDTVSFTDSSAGEIVEWIWYFGDGTILFGKNQDHSYDHMGDYRVTLYVTDANDNEDKYSKSIHISSSDDPYIPPPEDPENPTGYDINDLYPVFNTDKLNIQQGKIRVVVIDTGYTSRIYRGIDMTTVQGYKLDEFSSVYDDQGHGTFIIYEIASLLQTKCPNAEIISYKVFDRNGVSTPEGFLEALDLVKQLDPDLVSISAGAFGNVNDQYSKKIDELRKDGVVVLAAAAGNLGPDSGTILSPALSDSAIAVGSFNNMGTVELSDDTINEWSSRGPVYGVSHKPDVAGIGESIIGPWMHGERVVSGTSMATPMITAGSAVVLAEHKSLIGLVETFFFWDKSVIGQSFEDALKDSCRKPLNYDVDGGVNAWGAGVPDFALTSEIFYWKLITLLMIPILIIVGVVVALVYFFVIRKR